MPHVFRYLSPHIKSFRQQHKEKQGHLAEALTLHPLVAGHRNYDFKHHLNPNERGTSEGARKVARWRRACFEPDGIKYLKMEVAYLKVLADFERQQRRKAGLRPTHEDILEIILAAQTAAPHIPELPLLPSADEPEETDAETDPIEREERTLFGSTRPVRQVRSLK
jgi:hypothetical protein